MHLICLIYVVADRLLLSCSRIILAEKLVGVKCPGVPKVGLAPLGASAVWLLIGYNRFTAPSNMIAPKLSAISPLIMLSIISRLCPAVYRYMALARDE